MKFGRLFVIGKVGKTKNREILWKCQCNDKNEVIVTSHRLTSGKTKSCGCLQREITSKMSKGNSWNKNKKLSEETKNRISNSLMGRLCLETTKVKIRESLLNHFVSEETKRKISESKIGKCMGKNNSQFGKCNSEEKMQKCWEAQKRKPTKPELKLLDFLNFNFPNEWKYVGDGQIWISKKNPDFININGKKQLIELFGDYWHKPQDEIIREQHFEKYGFKTLIIWEKELKNLIFLKNKIEEFMGGELCPQVG